SARPSLPNCAASTSTPVSGPRFAATSCTRTPWSRTCARSTRPATSTACSTATSTRSSRPTWPGTSDVMKQQPEITIVDFDAGNLRSVQRALEAVGQRVHVTTDPRDVERAETVVLPGVGSAQDAMRKLQALGMVEPLREYAASGRPFLGVCVGLQLLVEASEEGGGVDCLGILPGVVRRFPAHPGLKIPQIGWNAVWLKYDHPLLDGIPGGTYFYFVHSYYADPT